MTRLRVLRVFIASPGGTEDERSIVRETAEELNSSLRDHGWRIEVFGWEERGPTGGRAQADINSEVRLCQVFIGVIWDRWGTPTGNHRSGFEEEWAVAKERFAASGSPDLWLYFKTKAPRSSSTSEQLSLVLDFKKEVEDTEIAFHKSFHSSTEFESQIRARLLSQVLFVSGLTKSDLGQFSVNWTSAFRKEPVSLIPDGEFSERRAEELLTSDPKESSRIFLELSTEMKQRRFEGQSRNFRQRACSALIQAGDLAAAILQARSILNDYAWWLEPQDAEFFIRAVESQFPPELSAEFDAWRACCLSPQDPEGSARTLSSSIRADYPIPIDKNSLAQWKVMLWQCLLHLGRAEEVPVDAPIDEIDDIEVSVELVLLRAEAMRQVQHPDASTAWSEANRMLMEQSFTHPATAARMATRWAFDQFNQEDFEQAESAYVDAAVRWSSAPGGFEEAARAFTSAQVAGRFRESWNFEGWGWGELTSSLPNTLNSFSRKGGELRRRALQAHVDGQDEDATVHLVAALWLFRRAGLVEGILNAFGQLGTTTRAGRNQTESVRYFCLAGDSKGAEAAAKESKDLPQVASILRGNWPSWTDDARFTVLAAIGRSARQDDASVLAAEAARKLMPTGRRFDHTHTSAAEALSALSVALEPGDPSIAKLRELAASDDFRLAKAGRTGLRMQEDLHQSGNLDLLIECFCNDARCDEPSPGWVADRLTMAKHRAKVEQAALQGKMRPLFAAVLGGLPLKSEVLAEYCRNITQSLLETDVGMTEDGEGIHGLMALDFQGYVAAASRDLSCQRRLADVLVLYASESRWPKVNRVSALFGLVPLLEAVGDATWFDRLRPLADPDQNLELDSPQHLNEMWSEPGDLEATALLVASNLSGKLPEWLVSAWDRARFDPRPPLREAAWQIAGSNEQTPFPSPSARYALNDESAIVRIAVIRSWGRKHTEALPKADVQRLLDEASVGEKLALIEAISASSSPTITNPLMVDSDGYVRGIAKSKFEAQAHQH